MVLANPPLTDNAPRVSPEEIYERARALLPVLRERAVATDQARRISPETMSDLYDAELLQILCPARFGGLELEWPVLLEAARILATACPSTAWIVAVVGGHQAIVGRMPLETQEIAFAEGPRQLFVSASAQTAGSTVIKVPGGYRINGDWRFASGSDNATWMMVNSPVFDEHGEKTSENARVVVPASEVEVVDTWFVNGMRGTGSKDLRFHDVFVPENRVVDGLNAFQPNPPGAAVNPGNYIYDVLFGPYFGSWLLGPLLGTAEQAYQLYLDGTRTRVGAMTRSTVAEMHTVQERLGESFSELDAARALYAKHTSFLNERGRARKNLTVDEQIDSARERTYIGRLCYEAIHRLVRQMGAVGAYESNPVQRYWRDLQVILAQVGINWDVHMLLYGRRALGVPTGNERFDNPPPERTPWGAQQH